MLSSLDYVLNMLTTLFSELVSTTVLCRISQGVVVMKNKGIQIVCLNIDVPKDN